MSQFFIGSGSSGSDGFPVAKFIVNPIPGLGTNTTISSANSEAVAGDIIFVTQGTYEETFIMTPGVTITALTADEDNPATTILGKITISGEGTYTISDINLQTNGDYSIEVIGSNICTLTLDGVNINCLDNTGINFTNSNSSSQINIYNSSGDIETTGIAIYSSSSVGTMYIASTFFTNSGNSLTASNNSAGSVRFDNCTASSAISTSSTGIFLSYNSNYNLNSLPVNVFAINGTGAQSVIFNSVIGNLNATSAISIGAGATLNICLSTVGNTAANWATGTGTLSYAAITIPSGGAIAGTLTTNLIGNFVGTPL